MKRKLKSKRKKKSDPKIRLFLIFLKVELGDFECREYTMDNDHFIHEVWMGIIERIKNQFVKSLLWRAISFNKKNFLWSTRNMPFFNTKDFVVSKQNFLELYEGNADISWAVKKIANNVSKNGLYLEDHKGNQLKDKSGDLEISGFLRLRLSKISKEMYSETSWSLENSTSCQVSISMERLQAFRC